MWYLGSTIKGITFMGHLIPATMVSGTDPQVNPGIPVVAPGITVTHVMIP